MSDTALAPAPDDAALQQQANALEGSGARKVARDARGGQTPKDFVTDITDDTGYDNLSPGAKYKAPDGTVRTKAYAVTDDASYEAVPEGALYTDPEGQSRTKPKYEGVDFTAQTLYNMSVNDKERRKALERSYPGKVKEQGGSLYVEDEGGVLRKPKGFMDAPGSFLTAQAAPVVGSIAGEIGGALLGSAAPGPGTIAGAVVGGAGGAAAGQGFNDIVMQLAGTYDRTAGEEAGNLGLSAAFGGIGTAVGRAASAAYPAVKGAVQNALPAAAAKFLGADAEGLSTGIALREQGVLVPPSAMYKEAPHLANIAEVFDPAFRTQKPLLQSATAHYEKQGAGILEELGVKEMGPLRPGESFREGSLVDPTAAPSTKAAGEALLARRLEASQTADARLQGALEAQQRATITGAGEHEATSAALQSAAAESRKEAEGLIKLGFDDIQRDVDAAMASARAGSNSGDLWWAVGEKLKAVRTGIAERAGQMYNAADHAAGGHLPDSSGLPEIAERFLGELPEGFERNFPSIVKQLQSLAGVRDEAGQIVKEAVTPSFGELHNLRSILRMNYNRLDLTPDIKQGTFKHFANKVDNILHDPGAVPELQDAAKLLREADTWYAQNMGPLNDRRIQSVMDGLSSGLPADPKVLFDTLVKEGRSDLTHKVADLVGPNLWAGVKAADVQEMMELSKGLLPDVIDGNLFVRQVLDRHRRGMLEAVHGKQASDKLLKQAQDIATLNGKLDVSVRPGDTVSEVVAKAKAAADAAKEAAKRDPLATLNKEMKQIKQDHARQLSQERRNDPLGFIYNPTVGASDAVDRILANEDLILAAGAKFGSNSSEFQLLRQIYAQRILQGTLEPGGRLAKITPEVQAMMFPGSTLSQMQTLAKEMDFLMSSKAAKDTAKSMAAVSKVEHPWSSIPLGKAAGKLVPGFDAAGRGMLNQYYKTVLTLSNNLTFMRWVEKGLKGDAAARDMVREQVQRVMQRGGAVGAGIGEGAYQTGTGEPQPEMTGVQ